MSDIGGTMLTTILSPYIAFRTIDRAQDMSFRKICTVRTDIIST